MPITKASVCSCEHRETRVQLNRLRSVREPPTNLVLVNPKQQSPPLYLDMPPDRHYHPGPSKKPLP